MLANKKTQLGIQTKMEKKIPKVSVCVMTYNQSKYIRKCIESLIEQDCDFQYEIIVSDDCSTDNTQEIIKELYLQYPGRMLIFLQDKNLGVKSNYLFLHGQARGEYIAHVDGDDYYFPGKLRLQAKYLDDNIECNIVWHPMLLDINSCIVNGYQQSTIDFTDMKFSRRDIIQLISVGKNSAKMYRKRVRDIDIPDFDLVDYLLNIEQVKTGYGAYASNEPLGVYRVGVGISSSGDKTRIALRDTFRYIFDKYPEYRLEVNTAALTYLLRDLKARRKSSIMFFNIWVRTFHPLSVFKLIKGVNKMNKLKYRT